MKSIDMRFDENMVKGWIRKEFDQFRCDPFDFTNSVTQIVGLYINGSVFSITNIQETVDYFGNKEDIAVCRLKETENSAIQSAFKNSEMISTPIGGRIDYITVVNEHQKVKNLKDDYEVWLTRGIIFSVDGREISFEKDNVPFSEEIIIRHGYNLLEKFTDVNDFLEGWEKGILAECHREVIEMKN